MYKSLSAMIGFCLAALLCIGHSVYQAAELRRLEACAIRQIESLIKICEANDIPLAQNIVTSEWCEAPKAMTQEEFKQFLAELKKYELETGLNIASGKPIQPPKPDHIAFVACSTAAARGLDCILWECDGDVCRPRFKQPTLAPPGPQEPAPKPMASVKKVAH